MSSSITGNAGGASASGAFIQCDPLAQGLGSLPTLFANADASGNFTFSGLIAGTYLITANAASITSGPYLGFVYRKAVSVPVDGVNNVTGVVIPNPVAANSSNAS
jgi:hypothetical protein